MWEITYEPAADGAEGYWVLSKDGEPYGAFFNETLANRVLAFLTNKWVVNKSNPNML